MRNAVRQPDRFGTATGSMDGAADDGRGLTAGFAGARGVASTGTPTPPPQAGQKRSDEPSGDPHLGQYDMAVSS